MKILDDIRTGHTIIQKSDDGDNCILLFGGANQSITEAQIEQTLENFSEGDALVLQNEINGLEFLMQKAKSKNMIVVLNPSPMNDNLKGLFKYADYILLNEIEAGQFLNENVENKSPEEISEKLHEKLPSVKIVLTLGVNGSVYYDGKNYFRQEAIKVKAVDTTAAGDTFTGFFLSGIFEGKNPEWALNFAANASAIAVTRHGAAPSIPTRNEVINVL